jgi:carbonic anhydrase
MKALCRNWIRAAVCLVLSAIFLSYQPSSNASQRRTRNESQEKEQKEKERERESREEREREHDKERENKLIARLMAGNARFVSGIRRPSNYKRERGLLTKDQHPYAVVVTCSDSRLSPELIFDESLGQLFVVRTAGNVIDPVVLGSVEYAVKYLNVGLVVLLGHESCGAVKAAIEGGNFSQNMDAVLSKIKPAIGNVRAKHADAKDMLPLAIEENVEVQLAALLHGAAIAEAFEFKGLKVARGVYHLNTGKVSLNEFKFVSEEEQREREREKKERRPGE